MIWSVSTSARSSTAALLVTLRSSLTAPPSFRDMSWGQSPGHVHFVPPPARFAGQSRVPSVLSGPGPGTVPRTCPKETSFELPHVREAARDRGRGGHLRRHEVRPPAGALAALEVPVGRRRAALARREDVRVHAEAHRAPGLAPLEARAREDTVEPLLLRLALHLRRARHDHRAHARRDPSAVDHDRRRAEVL